VFTQRFAFVRISRLTAFGTVQKYTNYYLNCIAVEWQPKRPKSEKLSLLANKNFIGLMIRCWPFNLHLCKHLFKQTDIFDHVAYTLETVTGMYTVRGQARIIPKHIQLISQKTRVPAAFCSKLVNILYLDSSGLKSTAPIFIQINI